MPATQREERALLGHDAFQLVAPTHYPEIEQLPPEELRSLATRLRAEHARTRDLIRAGRRAKRGKADPRAATSGEAGKATKRKQVYASALKRVNRRFEALTHERRRAEHRAALKAALARKNAARVHHPAGDGTAGGGMRDKANGKRRGTVHGARIGSVSAQNKRAQAKRDA
jgi:hypothetical protein